LASVGTVGVVFIIFIALVADGYVSMRRFVLVVVAVGGIERDRESNRGITT
jgi:hypothetical protein